MSRTLLFSLLVVALFSTTAAAEPQQCSYDTYQWSTIDKRSVNHQLVSHPYREVTHEEVDPQTGCTVCREDQVELSLPGIQPFLICRKIAPIVESALLELIEEGEPIQQVIGYRVGMTRGKINAQGLRTRFSNHSFGAAIDINPQHNGLYDRCIHFGPACRLIRGGEWLPQIEQASLDPQGIVVQRFKSDGFKWGGEIEGRQKDFMHFSPSGY